jgi:hypothetical protein
MIIKITVISLKGTELLKILISGSGYVCKDIIGQPACSDPE